jgi:hypothetical protein
VTYTLILEGLTLAKNHKPTWLLLIFAILLLLLPAALDFMPTSIAIGEYSLAAIQSAVGLLITVFLVDRFAQVRQQERDRIQFRNLSRTAYRSLSQSVNDMGRRLLGPIAGVDLYAAGIPGISKDVVAKYQETLSRNHFELLSVEVGFWNQIDLTEMVLRFDTLIRDREWCSQYFLFASASRRELQQALSDWAPTMSLDPDANVKLEAGWPLLDASVVLAESIRPMTFSREPETELEDDISAAKTQLERTISLYRKWLAELQEFAELPTKGRKIKESDWTN